ncbi:MAG: hypothetical protein C0506_14345 [Anaerolinea sp.]|nr:hypothetical protein [Anaerolinea sp.]
MTITRRFLLLSTMTVVLAAGAACGSGSSDNSDDSGGGAVPPGGDGRPSALYDSTTGGGFAPAAATPAARAVAELAKDAAAPGVSSSVNGYDVGGTTGLPAGSADFARKVIINATMSLNVKDVQAAFGEANRLARSAGGYVEKSSFSNPGGAKDESNLRATITLRIPAAQYDATLASLRSIEGAKVQSEGSKSSEVTEQYTDLQSRQRNLERTEGQYLKLLEQAKTIPEILQLNDRLDNVRLQIEQIQGRLKLLDQLSELTTIDLTLAPFPVLAKADGRRSLGEVFADAWEASLESVEKVAAAGIYAGVAALWLALPAGLVLLGARRVFRRDQGATPVA